MELFPTKTKLKFGQSPLPKRLSKLWLCLEAVQGKQLEAVRGTGKQHVWETISKEPEWTACEIRLQQYQYYLQTIKKRTISSSPKHFSTKRKYPEN